MGEWMKRISMIFKAPFEVDIAEQALPGIGAAEVLVKTKYSAISHGTEMLLYRGLFPDDLAVDETISELKQPLRYPLKYGYAAVGEVVDVGADVSKDFIGRMVFCLHPHESCFAAGVDEILPVPDDIRPQDALFLANMETAVNFLMDGRPLIGEKVAVLGQGVVGLLTAALLAKFPLAALLAMDHFKLRREASRRLGVRLALDSAGPDGLQKAIEYLDPGASEGSADLVYELSGNPAAVNTAIAIAGFDGRIVIGSWFGKQPAALELGGRFHRKRIRLIGSQVGTVTPALSARWSKHRRFGVAWDMIRRIGPARFITHRIPFVRVKEAFELIEKNPASTIQVILEYDPR
jgi:2-desacetyl-2-hydroxyethyl bacteriochlorophyllide A dehydrogenase